MIYKVYSIIIIICIPFSICAQIIIQDCKINNNTASQSGAGIFIKDETTIIRSLIQNNFSNGFGGGVSFNSKGKISNSLISNNSARNVSAGIYINSTDVLVESSTIANNQLTGPIGVGGVNIPFNCTIVNSIIWNNKKMIDIKPQIEGSGSVIYCAIHGSMIVGQGNETINDPSGINDNINFKYPNLNVGYSVTDTSWISSDWSLLPNSLALNKGNNQFVNTEFDIAGNQRIINNVVDFGAFEFNPELNNDIMLPENARIEFDLFPNPYNEYIFVNLYHKDKCRLSIYNQIGVLVWSDKICEKEKINLKHLKSGIYTVIVEFSHKKMAKKLIKY